ncbi:geranylgeranyl reductase family protein [Corynebacterium amycolatum]|uniref:geranylgeranyl reductase family protein n=1 Tax=Corynebacterium amycolatum TaxID=43765 RepID=UPI00396B33A5
MTSSPISRVSPTFDGTVALPSSTDVLIVGAGPTGSAAAIHAARAGFSVTVVDSQRFPRDKTCGDGLTPRAIAELRRLGLDDELLRRNRNRGLKLHGFGGSITAPWPDDASGTFPAVGSAMSRVELDTFLLNAAADAGAQVFDGVAARKVVLRALNTGGTRGHGVRAVELSDHEGKPHTISARWLLVADGVRSTVGKQLGRAWHRDSVFGVAARSYVSFDSADVADDWIHSHLELRDSEGHTHPGYGWIFPLGEGRANVGCGALATSARPARTNVKKLLREYHGQVRDQWQMSEPEHVTSALLPMGGAVSNVAGPNWALLGDAACLVNPLNGEGIDYGMESARLAVELISSIGAGRDGLTHSWPALLREHYGTGFSLARKLALTLTYPSFLPTVGPLTIGAPWGSQLMGVAARLMGNLVTEHDRDVVARLWRASGRAALASDKCFGRQPWQ